MKFSIINNTQNPLCQKVVHQISQIFINHGHNLASDQEDLRFVFNMTDMESPQFFRRKTKAVFVISFVVTDSVNNNMRANSYRALIRSLSNLLVCIVPKNGADDISEPELYFTTPEAGYYHFTFEPEAVYKYILPIAGAHFAIDNRLETDLPEIYWNTTPVFESIKKYGREMDRLGILPTPFPLKDVLSDNDIDYLYRLFEVKGISYGNLSAREHIPELGNIATFWMTARGINKAHIQSIGKDVLLVKGIDALTNAVLLSVPPHYDERARVSVDAVEHALIYENFPAVGAIIHIHAWMKNIPCTRQNYPCGTRELAEEVVWLLKSTENPAATTVGLKNHGLTITGPCLEAIFERIRGRILTEVEMYA